MYHALFEVDIPRIMRLCINITHVTAHTRSLRTWNKAWNNTNEPKLPDDSILFVPNTCIPTRLKSLTVEDSLLECGHGIGDLHQFTNLRSLSIHAYMIEEQDESYPNPVFFPHLESLTVLGGVHQGFLDPTSPNWTRFMDLNGPLIKYLDFHWIPMSFQKLLDPCQVLEHLVLSTSSYGRSVYDLKHPVVKYLDLRYWFAEPPPFVQKLAEEPLLHFPSLVSIRSIDGPLTTRSLPLLVPPHLQSDTNYEPFEFHFPGIHIRCERNKIIRLGLQGQIIDDPDDDDGEYEYNSEEGSISSSDIDLSDEQSDSNADIGHDEALSIFSRSLEFARLDETSSDASDSD